MSSPLNAARASLLLAPSGMVLAAIASILIARCLGPELYADYATMMALLAWLLLLAEGGCNAGLARFLRDAEIVNARGSLYRILQSRRWSLALILTVFLIWLGPVWAKSMDLQVERWQPRNFVLLGLLAAVMLHGQLANSALMAAFRHKRMLLLGQSMMVARAVTLGLLAGMLRQPVTLVVALLILATIESSMLHYTATSHFQQEQTPLPCGMANSAQAHGLVSLFDKLTTAFNSAPLLLLVLVGAHSRSELAMLAIASDLLQKLLAVVGMPISNLVYPMLNESRGDFERYRRQIARLGGLVTVLFATSAAGIAVCLPQGLPLLLGNTYSPAVPIAFIWLLPLFVEAGVRMVWGSALLTLDQYRWLVGFNLVSGTVSLLLIFVARSWSLTTLLVLFGVLRLSFALILLARAAHLRLLPSSSRPVGIVVAAGVSCALSLGVQALLAPMQHALQLLVGLSTYVLVMLTSLRKFPLIPGPAHDALCQLVGKRMKFLAYIIRPPTREHQSA